VQECLGRSYDLGDEVTEEDLEAELAMCDSFTQLSFIRRSAFISRALFPAAVV
jgi:hypothetical protein